MTMKELEEKYNDLVYMICKLNKQIDELQERCEEFEKRESIHNAIDGALNVQKQLDEHEKKINKIGESLLPFDLKLKEHDGRFRNVDTCLDAFVQRLDAADRKFADINVRLCNANEKSDKLKARLNMIFGAGGGLHLATYGMSIETKEEPIGEKAVRDAAKVIRDYCKDKNYCQKCPFFGWGPLWTRACEFMCTCPAGWKIKKKRCKKEDSSRPAMFLDEEE